jgi:uncharacterized protein with von Willebrand factor type A (vWA) domain
MLVRFFLGLREAGVPASVTEFLSLLRALEARVASLSAQEFYGCRARLRRADGRCAARLAQVAG